MAAACRAGGGTNTEMTIPSGNTDVADAGVQGGATTTSTDVTGDAGKDFVARVLGSTERVWDGIFQQMGQTYQKPNLVLFTGFVQSACGMAQSAMGPFYCPGDQQGLYRPVLLPGHEEQARRTRRLRAGLCDRP